MRFVVIFDSCVFYPAPLRDFVMHLAITDIFAARWTEKIHEEWMQSLLRDRPELSGKLERPRDFMNKSIRNCLVTGYEHLIPSLKLPDENDRHVLAAAIRCGAQIIVTFNLKDFPSQVLDLHGIEAMHPDVFVEHQMSLYQGIVINAAKNHRANLKNPPKSAEAYLSTLAAQGLVVTANQLREFVELI